MALRSTRVPATWEHDALNFDFSDDQKQIGSMMRRILDDRGSLRMARAVLDGPAAYDHSLWRMISELGFVGSAIPVDYGGGGLGDLEVCLIAEELGRALAPIPFSSSAYLAAELILRAGDEQQKQTWLPQLASGKMIGTLAFVEQFDNPTTSISTIFADGAITGNKIWVPDGDVADIAIVVARDQEQNEAALPALFLVSLSGNGTNRQSLAGLDPTRSQACIQFNSAAAEPLGHLRDGWMHLTRAIDRAAVMFAFEQVGAAERALEMARNYALERTAFGRQIGSFQAIKHMLADMYVQTTLARSNAYYGAYALSASPQALPIAAAAARISATQAFQRCAKDNIQVHGGLGFTWESDCQLFYRRSNLLALTIGSLSVWESRLIEQMHATAA